MKQRNEYVCADFWELFSIDMTCCDVLLVSICCDRMLLDAWVNIRDETKNNKLDFLASGELCYEFIEVLSV